MPRAGGACHQGGIGRRTRCNRMPNGGGAHRPASLPPSIPPSIHAGEGGTPYTFMHFVCKARLLASTKASLSSGCLGRQLLPTPSREQN